MTGSGFWEFDAWETWGTLFCVKYQPTVPMAPA